MPDSLIKGEFLGDMPPNKTYRVRQAYFWIFTHPGCFLGGVVEIREARNHGAVMKTRRYSVMEQDPQAGGRVFLLEKPAKEWKGDGAKKHTVVYTPGDRRNQTCTCESFRRRSKCAHLEALLSLTNRQPTARPDNYKPPKEGKAHEWERRGRQSYRCVWCGVRAWNPELMDRDPTARMCLGGGPASHPADQEPKSKKVSAEEADRRDVEGPGEWNGPTVSFNYHDFRKTKTSIPDPAGDRASIYRCTGCGVGTTEPDDHEGSDCHRPTRGTAHRFTQISASANRRVVEFRCDRCGTRTERPHDRTGEVCPGNPDAGRFPRASGRATRPGTTRGTLRTGPDPAGRETPPKRPADRPGNASGSRLRGEKPEGRSNPRKGKKTP